MVSVIAKKLRDARDHKALTAIFDEADVSNDGKISIQEYLTLCENYGIEMSEDDLNEVRKMVDENGEFSRTDFIQHIKKFNMLKEFDSVDPESDHYWNEKVKKAWKLFDKNKDGRISQEEFRWMTSQGSLSKSQIVQVFTRVDKDGDGFLNFKEFKNMIMKNRSRKEIAKKKAEVEEANRVVLIPHWKKGEIERRQKLKEEQDKMEEVEKMENTEDKPLGDTEVKTDDEIEEDLDNFVEAPKKAIRREPSEYSDIPEDVVEDKETIEIEEDLDDTDQLEEVPNMTTVKLKLEHQKGISMSQLKEVLRGQWHRDFRDYSVQKIESGQEFDVYSVSLKVPKTILPEHYFVYKQAQPRFRNLVLMQ